MAAPAPKLGDTLGHYRLLEQIGAGGMGVVYRAHDERLDRDVALKILPPGTVSETTRVAFRREALALSKLNHPNIATVFDLNHDHGVDYLVMELVSGINLDQMLFTAPLAERDIIRLGMQLAEGLAAAHDQAVVHRDLKPGNVRVRDDGHLKILDFGLARVMHPVSDAARTSSLIDFAVAGTLPYMAPEQLRNQRIDARADIWALGAVLYEMATGKRAFPETHPPLLIESILHQAPQHPAQANPQVSPGLAAIIQKCLDREPENRYQSAKEVAVDLRRLASPTTTMTFVPAPPQLRLRPRAWWLAAAAVLLFAMVAALGPRWRDYLPGQGRVAPQVRSIAVLPFENLSGNPEHEYLADGVTDALISELARLRGLDVISRRSSMQYKNSTKPTSQIAQELKVEAVLEGSLLREGDRVSITARLVEASSDHSLWTGTYERDLRDVLSLRTEFARAVAREVRLSVSADEQARLQRASPSDPEANDLYFRGRYQLSLYTLDGYKQALSLFQQAVAKDPTHALAYAGIADCYSLLGDQTLPGAEAATLAKAAARKALQLEDTLPEAHVALAYAQFLYDWDWEAAEKRFARALELAPGSAAAHERFAWYLIARGRLEEAQQRMQQARRLDPLNPATVLGLSAVFYYRGEPDLSLAELRKAAAGDTGFIAPPYALALNYTQQGDHEKALAELQNGDNERQNSPARAQAAYIHALAGRKPEAKRILEQLVREGKKADSYHIAFVHAALGERDAAFRWLEKALTERHGALVWVKVDPRFQSIRGDARWAGLLERIGL
jgi:serine/threonine-protein kinase